MPDEVNQPGTQVASAAQPQGSAPETNNQQDAGGVVETTKKQSNEGLSERGLKADLITMRGRTRNAEAEAQALRAENEALKKRHAEPSRQESPVAETTVFDDPAGFSRKTKEESVKESVQAARDEARKLYEQGEAERVWKDNAGKTATWLLSRSHLKQDPNAKNEIYGFVDQATLERNPKAAVRDAYLDWCESKGIVPDLEHKAVDYSSAHNGTGVRPSATGSGNGSGEVTLDQLRAMSEPERRRAISEGRYKGKVIRAT